MPHRASAAVSAVCFYLFATAFGSDGEFRRPRRLLLVSMDGFRWDYLSKTDTPNFRQLISEGAYAERLKSVFPSQTYPSHWSIVTGNTVENHGVVANNFYDPTLRRMFTVRSREELWWNATEPIWVTAMRNNLSAATYFWPGSEVEIHGYRPKYWFNFTSSVSMRDQIDTAIDWLGNKSIDMATIYTNEPDVTGHDQGPDSPEVVNKIKEMDALLGYLMSRLRDSGLEKSTNLLLVSDHGMTSLDNARVIDVTHWINISSDLVSAVPGAVVHFFPKPGMDSKVYNALKGAHPNMAVYWQRDIPERFNFKNNQRIGPIVAIADKGWYITNQNSTNNKGGHGYDNVLSDMKAFMIARGPDFKVGYKVQETNLLNIYPLMCRLLNIKPQPYDGSLELVDLFVKSGTGMASASVFSGAQSVSCLLGWIVIAFIGRPA